jgi:hypothetical protein
VLIAILATCKGDALFRSKKQRRGWEEIERRGWEEEVGDEGRKVKSYCITTLTALS